MKQSHAPEYVASSIDQELSYDRYATKAYKAMVEATDSKMSSEATYVPLSPAQQLDNPQHLRYAEQDDVLRLMMRADAIVCLSRYEQPNPGYSDDEPSRNSILAPDSISNVDRGAELYHIARKAGNDRVQFISTGRMIGAHAKTVVAFPRLGEVLGIPSENAFDTPEADFEELLQTNFTPERAAILLEEFDDVVANAGNDAIKKALGDLKIPTAESTEEEIQAVRDALLKLYKDTPRVAMSTLMNERAQAWGIPPEVLHEDPEAVDTISNIMNVLEMLQDDNGDLDGVRELVLVAGSDHLPRTMWIADHLVPQHIKLVGIESDPKSPSLDAFNASCEREQGSFDKGSGWIGWTQDSSELWPQMNEGYYGIKRTSEQKAREVAGRALKESQS